MFFQSVSSHQLAQQLQAVYKPLHR